MAENTAKFGVEQSWFQETFISPTMARQPVFEPVEVAALIKFASEEGIDTDDHLVTRLYFALLQFEDDNSSTSTVVQNGQQEEVLNSALVLQYYTDLTKLCDGINGRNIQYGRHIVYETKSFMITTLIIFVVCVTTLAIGSWVERDLFEFKTLEQELGLHLVQFFTPFFWGALGACIYILKRITDEAGDHRFDPDKFRGWLTKLTLGAVLGGSITYIIDPDTFGQVTLSTTAIAFLTGLGTKVVYGALERVIDLLADKLNLDAIRKRQKPDKDAISQFLAERLGEINAGQQPEEYRVLVQLLEEHGQRP